MIVTTESGIGVGPAAISHILLTSLHGDHFGGIPFLVRETQSAAERTAPVENLCERSGKTCATARLCYSNNLRKTCCPC